jgi:EAL domain-containing protein (putative c-di-GMP-specific phosphodiesterase class I)
MGLDALAEGVETPEEQATLVELGCAYVQGFGLARPMALSDTFAWLEAQDAGTPRTEAGRHLRPAE